MCVTDPWTHMSLVHSILSLKLGVTVFDFARTVDNMYKNDHDGYTSSEALKEMIELLFVKPIPK